MDDVLADILSYCVLPVIAQVTDVFLKIFGFSLIVSISTNLRWNALTYSLDVVLGLLCSVLFYQSSTLYLGLLVVLSYAVLVLSSSTGKCGAAILLTNLLFVFISELALVEPELWHQIRGSVILLLMKTSSVGFDLDAGVVTPPSLLTFAGYCLSPVSLIFGPFVTLPDYRRSKSAEFNRDVLLRGITSVALAYLCVLLSTCLLPSFGETDTSFMSTYLTAQSFRASHYFVCYTSQVSAIIGGFSSISTEKFQVVNPLQVEIPRSMARVAVSWNLPMHYWLKTYVYKKTLPFGMYVAAFFTYAASSVLHGLNFQLPAVLVSIFFFASVETNLREELSLFLDSCVRVSTCRTCTHRNEVFVVPVRLFFVAVNIVQLAYLGVMFDFNPLQAEGYSWWNTVSKWQALGWYGHLAALLGILVTAILKVVNKKRN